MYRFGIVEGVVTGQIRVAKFREEEKKKRKATAANVTTELNIHVERLGSTKIVFRDGHLSNCYGKAVTTKLLISEVSTKLRTKWCTDHKP